MKFLSIFILSLVFCLHVHAEIDANEIVKKADLKRGLGGISHSFDVDIENSNGKTETYHVSFRDINASLTIQTAPERSKGRKLLMKDYDIWLYTPNIKKPIRISLEQKLTGEVSNGDIARTNYADDYHATLIETIKNSQGDFYKLDLKARNNKVTYGKIEYIVAKKDYAPIEATFFAISGKPLKKAKYSDFKKIKGMMRSTKMIIQDFIMKDKTSIMISRNHKEEIFEDNLFNKDGMEL